MKTYSYNKPEVFEAIGDGSFRYNYNIKEIEVDRFDIIDNENKTNIKETQWTYQSWYRNEKVWKILSSV